MAEAAVLFISLLNLFATYLAPRQLLWVIWLITHSEIIVLLSLSLYSHPKFSFGFSSVLFLVKLKNLLCYHNQLRLPCEALKISSDVNL